MVIQIGSGIVFWPGIEEVGVVHEFTDVNVHV